MNPPGELNPTEVLDRLAHLIVPAAADLCVFSVSGSDRDGEPVEPAHHRRLTAVATESSRRGLPMDWADRCADLILGQLDRPLLFGNLSDELVGQAYVNDWQLVAIRGMGLRSVAAVPLIARQAPLGALLLASTDSNGTFGAVDLSLAIGLARIAALALDGHTVNVRGVARDISERIQAEEALALRARQQAAVADFGLWALTGAALPLLETATLDVLTTVLELELGALLKVGADCRSLVLCGALGWPPTVIGRRVPGLDAAVLHELSLQCGRPLSLDELSSDPRLSLEGLVPPGREVCSGLVAVLAGQDGPRGALVVLSEQPRTFSADDRSFVQAIANVLGAAIERTDAESELRQREHVVRELLEHATECIFRVDADLRFQYVNPAVERTTGIPVAEFIGKTGGELGQPEALIARWDMALRRVFRSGRPDVVELKWSLFDGERDLEVRLSPETGPDGEILSILGVAHDVTADRLAEAERADLYRKLLERDSRLTALVERVLPRQAVRAIELSLLRVSLPLEEPARALSAREHEVLRLIAYGRSDRAIAGELVLAESTVKFHVKSILRKLDARTRAEAVGVAAKLDLL